MRRTAMSFCSLPPPACWGVGTVLSKQALNRGVAPLTLLVLELAVTTLRQRLTLSPSMAKLAALGLLNPGLAYTLGLLRAYAEGAPLRELVGLAASGSCW
ncbi:hypothetical protein ACWZJV_09135 [Nocardioides sp. WG-D5]